VSADDFDAVLPRWTCIRCGHARQRDIDRTDRSLREGRQASRCSVSRAGRVGQCAERTASIWSGKRVTGFTNAEEEEGLERDRAFLVGRPAQGTGIYSKTANCPGSKWTEALTGQNPASSDPQRKSC